MKAVTWHGKRDVSVDEVPDPTIEEPTDAIVRITSTAICGSDLHLYEVLGPFMSEGDILGHEPMGIVEEVGSEVDEHRARRPRRDAVPDLLRPLLHVRAGAAHPVRDDPGARAGHGRRAVRLHQALRRRCPAGRRSTCACRRRTTARSRCRRARPTSASSTSPTCCPPPGRRSSTPACRRAARVVVLGLGPIGDMACRIAQHRGRPRDRRRPRARAARARARDAASRRSTCASTTTILGDASAR